MTLESNKNYDMASKLSGVTFCLHNNISLILYCIPLSRNHSCFIHHRLSFLKTTASLDESGTLQWAQVLTLLLAWIVVWLCMIKGIKTAGKVEQLNSSTFLNQHAIEFSSYRNFQSPINLQFSIQTRKSLIFYATSF